MHVCTPTFQAHQHLPQDEAQHPGDVGAVVLEGSAEHACVCIYVCVCVLLVSSDAEEALKNGSAQMHACGSIRSIAKLPILQLSNTIKRTRFPQRGDHRVPHRGWWGGPRGPLSPEPAEAKMRGGAQPELGQEGQLEEEHVPGVHDLCGVYVVGRRCWC